MNVNRYEDTVVLTANHRSNMLVGSLAMLDVSAEKSGKKTYLIAIVAIAVIIMMVVAAIPMLSSSVEHGTKVVHNEYNWTYYWDYDGVEYVTDVNIDRTEFAEYDQDYRGPGYPARYNDGQGVAALAKYAVSGKTITALAAELRYDYAQVNPYMTDADLANYMLAFIQVAIGYADDSSLYNSRCHVNKDGSMEYWAYPIQTLYYGAGDCEDTTILCNALFNTQGYDTSFMYFRPYANNPISHVMTGIYLENYVVTSNYAVKYTGSWGTNYFGAETTISSITEIGYDALGQGRTAGMYVNWGDNVYVYKCPYTAV